MVFKIIYNLHLRSILLSSHYVPTIIPGLSPYRAYILVWEGVEENKYLNKIILESDYCYEEHKVG